MTDHHHDHDHERRAETLHERLAQAAAGPGGTKVAYPIRLRRLSVLRVAPLGPTLVRLTLGGPDLDGFHSHVPEEHVRLVFPDAEGTLRLPERDGEMLRWPRSPAAVSREYTVRRHDEHAGELDVDVVVHPGGVGSDWSGVVREGDEIDVAGPPGGFVVPGRYTHHLLAGDITALPQIARYLERLPADARGWAIVEVRDSAEEIPLTAPAGFDVRWVHRGALPPGAGDALEKAVRAVPVPPGETFVWVAGEAGAIKPLRRWASAELGLPPSDVRITGYWKRGTVDFDED